MLFFLFHFFECPDTEALLFAMTRTVVFLAFVSVCFSFLLVGWLVLGFPFSVFF